MKCIRSAAALCAAVLLCLSAAGCAGDSPAKSLPGGGAASASGVSAEKTKLEEMSVGLKAAKCSTTLNGLPRDGIRLELSYDIKFNTDDGIPSMELGIVFPEETLNTLGTDSTGTRNLSLEKGQRELKGTDVSEFYPDHVPAAQLQKLLSSKTPYTVELHLGKTVIRRQAVPAGSAEKPPLRSTEAEEVAKSFSVNALSDFADKSGDSLIAPDAFALKQFLSDKREIKQFKEQAVGRTLQSVRLDIRSTSVTEEKNCYEVLLEVESRYLDGDTPSEQQYFNKVVVDRKTGYVVAASTSDLSGGTLLHNQCISSGKDLIVENQLSQKYLGRGQSAENTFPKKLYDLEKEKADFAEYVQKVRSEK